jgi:uncharacterized repeat protein (TIGR01451 family)
MKKASILVAAISVGVTLLAAQPALAWHPEVDVKKSVQNITAKSALADANTNSAAVAAQPGDTLKYVIEISNPAKAADNKWNDLVKVTMTDTLPAGVELVSNPSQRTLTEKIDRLVPGQKITKEYTVKVTSKNDATYINNNVCVDGNSEANDAYRKDCDNAIVKVNVPVTPKPEEPKPEEPKTETPVETPKEEVPAELPATGPEAFVVTGLGISAAAYGAVRAARSRMLKK